MCVGELKFFKLIKSHESVSWVQHASIQGSAASLHEEQRSGVSRVIGGTRQGTGQGVPVCRFAALAKELSVVLPISFYERANNAYYNSVAVIDADGAVLGRYRKAHIPDGPGYQEKWYFTPGDSGFQVPTDSYPQRPSSQSRGLQYQMLQISA